MRLTPSFPEKIYTLSRLRRNILSGASQPLAPFLDPNILVTPVIRTVKLLCEFERGVVFTEQAGKAMILHQDYVFLSNLFLK